MTFSRRVAFSETDASGRVHFASILKWAEDAEHQCLGELGVTVFGVEDGWPRVRVSCDYLRSIEFGDEVTVSLELSAIGASSLTWRFEVTTQAGEQAAKGEMTTVWVCKGKKAMISDEVRRRLESKG